MSRTGVYGGSFNPVHNGHLKLAKAALELLNLDKVVFVPTHVTPLRETEAMLPASLRVKMLKAAAKGDRRLEVSTVEVERKGLSFTVDTLKYLKAKSAPGTVLYFLSGADQPSEFRRWKSWNEIPRLCRFIVMSRPGHRVKNLPEDVHFLHFEALDVSSTEIRERLRTRKPVRDLMPEGAYALLTRYGVEQAAKKAKEEERAKAKAAKLREKKAAAKAAKKPKKAAKAPKKGVLRSKPTGRSK